MRFCRMSVYGMSFAGLLNSLYKDAGDSQRLVLTRDTIDKLRGPRGCIITTAKVILPYVEKTAACLKRTNGWLYRWRKRDISTEVLLTYTLRLCESVSRFNGGSGRGRRERSDRGRLWTRGVSLMRGDKFNNEFKRRKRGDGPKMASSAESTLM